MTKSFTNIWKTKLLKRIWMPFFPHDHFEAQVAKASAQLSRFISSFLWGFFRDFDHI